MIQCTCRIFLTLPALTVEEINTIAIPIQIFSCFVYPDFLIHRPLLQAIAAFVVAT